MTTSASHAWFAESKFTPPALGADLLDRAALRASLDKAIRQHILTLISAPAGSGKTTLAAAWVAASSAPIAWLRLDRADSDPGRFLTALVTAVRTQYADYCPAWETQIGQIALDEQGIHRFVALLINGLADAALRPCTIVLDDLHLLKKGPVADFLTLFIDQLPPDIRIVGMARFAPPLALARWRLQGQLAEFALADLRFSPRDARQLLTTHLRLELDADAFQLFYKRSEGWIAALRLLAVSLVEVPVDKRLVYLQQLRGAGRALYAYLGDEILAKQSPELRQFLLEVAILDELTPTVCTAVTGTVAERHLDTLAERHLLVRLSTTDAGTVAYRFHELFADFLRQRLRRDVSIARRRQLHHRAAKALAGDAAIHHYLAGEWWEEAAEQIEAIGLAENESGFVRLEIKQWIAKLPAYYRETRPYVGLLLGVIAYRTGRQSEAHRYLERARKRLEEVGDTRAIAWAHFYLAPVTLEVEGPEATLKLMEDTDIRLLPLPLQIISHIILTWAHLALYNWESGEKHMANALDLALQAKSITAFQLVLQHIGVTIYFGDLPIDRFRHFCDVADALFGETNPIITMGVALQRAIIATLTGDIAQGVSLALQANEVSQRLGGFAYIDQNIGFPLGVASLVNNDAATLQRALDDALRQADARGQFRAYLIAACYSNARLAWLDDDAQRIADIHTLLQSIDHRVQRLEAEAIGALLEAYGADLAGRHAEAEERVRYAVRLQARFRHGGYTGDSRLVLAELYFKWKRPDDAAFVLREALAEWRGKKMVGVVLFQGPSFVPLLEFAAHKEIEPEFAAVALSCLSNRETPTRIAIPGGTSSLTPREAEVLALLMEGASNKSIAEKLVVTPRTAKAHVTNIMRKLNVNSRTEAVARAFELGLIRKQ